MGKEKVAKKYSYVTLLTNDSYLNGVILLKESLRRVKSKYPLLCLITEDVSEVIRNTLTKLKIEFKIIDKIETPQNIMENNLKINPTQATVWKYVLTKFQIFTLEEFDKIIFLDADLLIWKNVDHCFEMPHMTAAVDGEYSNLWPLYPHFNAGFMVIKPNKQLFEALIEYTKNLDINQTLDFAGRNYVIADQEILNHYYSDWKNETEKHLSKYYNIFPIHVSKNHTEDLLENGYFFHFVGMKPWGMLNGSNMAGLRENLSVLTVDMKEDTRCDLFYELAYTIIDLVYRADFDDLDWNRLESEGIFDFYIAHNCVGFFRDLETARRYIDKAIQVKPTEQEYIRLKNTIIKQQELTELKPLVLEVLKKIANKAVDTKTPTLDLFHAIEQLSKTPINTETSLVITDRFWNVIEKGVEDYINSIYNDKKWGELLYV